jgi:hypothetical protein
MAWLASVALTKHRQHHSSLQSTPTLYLDLHCQQQKPPHVHSYSSFATISAGSHARLRPDLSGTCLAVRARDIQTLAKGVFGKAIEFAPASHGNLTVGEETIVTGIEL